MASKILLISFSELMRFDLNFLRVSQHILKRMMIFLMFFMFSS